MNLVRIWVDLLSNLKMLWRNKSNMVWTLVFPILLMVIFGSIFSVGQQQQLVLFIEDNDHSALSTLFTDSLNASGAFVIKEIPSGTEGTALDKTIKDQSIHRLLIFPAGFNATFAIYHTANLTLLLDQADQQGSAATYQIVQSIAYQLSLRLVGTGAGGIVVPNNQFLPSQAEFRYIDFFLPGIIGLTIMTSGVYGAIAVNTRYRKNGILRKVATTPMTKAEWVIAKVCYQIVLAFISMTSLILVGVLAYHVKVHLNLLVFLLVITGSMTFSGLGMIVARFVKDEEAAESAGSAINFPMMFLSGIFFPIEFMPKFLQPVGQAMPLYYLAQGLRSAMVTVDLQSALVDVAVIFVLAVVIIGIGSVVSAWTDE